MHVTLIDDFISSICYCIQRPFHPLFLIVVMIGWNEDWTTRAVQPITTIYKDPTTATAAAGGGGGGGGSTSDSNGGNSVVCDEWVDHSVLVVQRDTFANFFHDSEDFVNVFLALAILQWTAGDTQLFLTDLYPQVPPLPPSYPLPPIPLPPSPLPPSPSLLPLLPY